MISINDKAYSIFVFGHWVPPKLGTLTPQEQKVFNMIKARFPRETIQTRLRLSESRVRGLIIAVTKKGWL